MVCDLISWRYSFELVCRELELTRKKKEALNNLLAISRISQSTYEYLEKELTEAVLDLEAHQKSLADKMTVRADSLERQIKSLELFLANLEVHHAAGEIDEETYDRQNQAITLGLEATRKELGDIKSSLTEVVSASPKISEVAPETSVEVTAPEVVSESVPEPSVESESVQEGVTAEEAQSTELPPEPPSLVMPQEEPASETGSQNP